MSEHVRKQIRDHVTERLRALGLNTSWNWSRPFEEMQLPAGTVLTENETSQVANLSGTLQRQLDVAIAVVIHGDPDRLADDLDGYAVRLETGLGNNPPTPAKRFELVSTDMELMDEDDGARWYGLLVLEFQAIYFTKRGAPEVSA